MWIGYVWDCTVEVKTGRGENVIKIFTWHYSAFTFFFFTSKKFYTGFTFQTNFKWLRATRCRRWKPKNPTWEQMYWSISRRGADRRIYVHAYVGETSARRPFGITERVSCLRNSSRAWAAGLVHSEFTLDERLFLSRAWFSAEKIHCQFLNLAKIFLHSQAKSFNRPRRRLCKGDILWIRHIKSTISYSFIFLANARWLLWVPDQRRPRRQSTFPINESDKTRLIHCVQVSHSFISAISVPLRITSVRNRFSTRVKFDFLHSKEIGAVCEWRVEIWGILCECKNTYPLAEFIFAIKSWVIIYLLLEKFGLQKRREARILLELQIKNGR